MDVVVVLTLCNILKKNFSSKFFLHLWSQAKHERSGLSIGTHTINCKFHLDGNSQSLLQMPVNLNFLRQANIDERAATFSDRLVQHDTLAVLSFLRLTHVMWTRQRIQHAFTHVSASANHATQLKVPSYWMQCFVLRRYKLSCKRNKLSCKRMLTYLTCPVLQHK